MIKNQVIEKYNEGLISQLEVLEAERSLITSEISLLLMHQQLLSDTVTLYKALGGGWPVTEIKPSDISEANEN
jgi:outer membrane protein TolC